MKALLLALCAVTSLLSCDKHGGVDCIEPNGDYSVELNGCVEKGASADGTLCLLQVNDSRCPVNSQCVWEGVGTAKFSFTTGGTQHQISLATKKFAHMPSLPSNDTTIAGYKIQLIDIKPYPGGPVEPVRAIVRITR